MFKRMQKLNDRMEKDRKNGLTAEDQGPPEMALNDDSDSESSSSSSSEGESGSEQGDGTRNDSDVERKKMKGISNSNSAGSEEEDDEGAESEDISSAQEDEDEDEDDDDAPLISIAKSQIDPIFVHPRAASKAGFVNRNCHLCPDKTLKTEKAITVHLQGASHARRMKRFQEYCNKNLSESERQEPRKGGLDAKKVVMRMEKSLAAKEAKQAKHRAQVKIAAQEAKRRRATAKKERKQKEKVQKEETKKQLLTLNSVPNENGKTKQSPVDREAARGLKKEKAKRQKKLKRVMPTKAERKAAKKERQAVKIAAKREAARLKAKDGTANKKES